MNFSQHLIILSIFSTSANCINANLDNPCDLKSESFLGTLFFKTIFNDSSTHCGFSIQFNNSLAPTKNLATMNTANHTVLKFEDGRLKAWGNGNYGQLGFGNTANIADGSIGILPIQTSQFIPITEKVKQVAAGDIHTCALLVSGDVYCWGDGNYSKLGYNNLLSVGDGVGPSIDSAGIVPIGAKVTQIAVGTKHSCAILTTGSVRCWGYGAFGQLGYDGTADIAGGTGQSIIQAGDVPLGGIAVQIATGDTHTCALLNSGAVRCWGGNSSGQLGYNITTPIGNGGGQSIIQAGDVPLGGQAVQIVIGSSHSCALLSNGAVRCWGEAADGNLGYNSSNSVGDSIATSIINTGDVPVGGVVTQITAGTTHTCALLTTGKIRCWGDGSSGQLGYNINTKIGDGSSPSILTMGDLDLGGIAKEVSAGSSHTCALLTTGSVRCWGNGGDGRLGYNSINNIADGQGANKTILQAGDLVLE